jgi:hypothetical protein
MSINYRLFKCPNQRLDERIRFRKEAPGWPEAVFGSDSEAARTFRLAGDSRPVDAEANDKYFPVDKRQERWHSLDDFFSGNGYPCRSRNQLVLESSRT